MRQLSENEDSYRNNIWHEEDVYMPKKTFLPFYILYMSRKEAYHEKASLDAS